MSVISGFVRAVFDELRNFGVQVQTQAAVIMFKVKYLYSGPAFALTFLLSQTKQAVLTNTTTNETYTQNGLKWSSDLRMNHIQIIGTHNSHHREVSLQEKVANAMLLSNPQDYYYSHADLDHQLEYQSIRSLELDIWAGPEGGKYATPLVRKLAHLDPPSNPAMNKSGTKILHVSDADHVPIPFMIKFKTSSADIAYLGGATPLPWNDTGLLASLDAEFRSVFSPEQVITPDDIRRGNLTLEESVLTYGWPTLESARGRVMFLMDDGSITLGDVRTAYRARRENPEGRVIFTQSAPGQSDCAFQKLNTPNGTYQAQIQDAVSKNYWVRTGADIPIDTILAKDTTMRDAAFSSGAQMVTTDWPVYGMDARYNSDYVVRFVDGATAGCNPVTSTEGCELVDLEPLG